MYLVLWRTTMEDVPIRLFRRAKEAEEFAASMTEHDAHKASDAMGIDISSLVNVAIVRFRSSGTVRGLKFIRDVYTAEEDAEAMASR